MRYLLNCVLVSSRRRNEMFSAVIERYDLKRYSSSKVTFICTQFRHLYESAFLNE